MRTVSNAVFSVTYPNVMFETRGRFAYIKVQLGTPEENVDVELQIGSNPILMLNRVTDKQGIAVFPVGRIFEVIGNDSPSVKVHSLEQGLSAMRPIVGYAKSEIENGFLSDTPWYPAVPCVVAYPNLGLPQPLFLPYTGDFSVISQSVVELGYTDKGPIVEFDASKIPEQDLGTNIGVGVNPDLIDMEIKTYYDYCTSGVFLKWTDAAGVPYLYRWTQETETDDVSVDSTYRQLDDTLTPYDVQVKTRAKRFTLHSRIVERDIFEMCRTILGAQEVFMYDRDANDWVRVLIEDVESEDTGAVMQDVEIEVVKYEYL